MKRRDFIKGAGAAGAAAVVTGCGKKGDLKVKSEVFPPPKGIIPGVPRYIKSTCTECPAGCGLDVRVLDGVALKLEGTVGHPVNDGRLCSRGQAFITRLYSPDRVTTPMMRQANGEYVRTTWEKALFAIRDGVVRQSQKGGRAVYLSGRTTGSLDGFITHFCADNSIERAKEYEAIDYASIRSANQSVFGTSSIPHYNIKDSDFLITVGADVIQSFVSPVSNALQLAKAKAKDFSWTHIEPHVSLEGLKADKRLVVKPGSEAALLKWLYDSVSVTNRFGSPPQAPVEQTGLAGEELNRLLSVFRSARKPLIITGGVATGQDNGYEAAFYTAAIQASTGMHKQKLIDFSKAQDWEGVGTLKDLKSLASKLAAGKVGVLFITRTDPVGTAPDSINFRDALKKAAVSVAIADHMTETAAECDIVLPVSHGLEEFGDYSPNIATLSVQQPAVDKKLHDTKSEGDILISLYSAFGKIAPIPSYDAYLKKKWGSKATDLREKGFISVSVANETPVTVSFDALGAAARGMQTRLDGSVLYLAPSARYYDGRSRYLKLANEIPDPLTTITYGEWVSVSDYTEGGPADGDVYKLTAADTSVELPVKRQPRLAEKVLMVDRGLLAVKPFGFHPVSGEAIVVSNVKLEATGDIKRLPIMSGSPSQEGRGIVPNPVHLKNGKPVKKEHADHGGHHDTEGLTLYPDRQGVEKYQLRFAMTIDLDKCTGCGACVSACYIENNIPMVGEREHVVGREMSWIRIEPYYDREEGVDFLPMICQQCDNAPCEPVCPVFAAYHNPDGLNAQIYNRCVGTRYCANNCPYKVRRFNWFDHKQEQYPLNMVKNPDVSLRGRGIMEKCTFCVQRIRAGKDMAKDENRAVRDGDIIPACAQTCPSEAIVFGNILDEKSLVAELSKSERRHKVLEELGTQPAVTYLGGIMREKEA